MFGRRTVTWIATVLTTATMVGAPALAQARVHSRAAHTGRTLKEHCITVGLIRVCYVT